MSDLEAVWRTIDDSREEMLTDLFTLLRQPSISAQDVGVAECAELLVDLMRTDGLDAKVVPTAGHPAVLAKSEHVPGAPTVLVYGHYDVQPTEPDDAWTSPPFEPTVRDGRVYARGSGDNKGQIVAQLMAHRAWRRAVGRAPVNLTFVVDGEEESGSPHLPDVIRENRDYLAADLVYLSDGPVYRDGQYALSMGVRGLLAVEVEVRGASRDYHSGHMGNVLPNPAWELAELLASMRDGDGRILVPGFYDDVREAEPAAREAAAELPADADAFMREHGVDRLAPTHFDGFADRTMFYPALNLSGLAAGYTGAGSKTIIPSSAVARFDIRLVVDQDPDDIYAKFAAHVAKVLPHATVRRIGGSVPPSRTPVDHPAVPLVRDAVANATGRRPLVIPGTGGTLPDFVFTGILGLPLVKVPYANPDEANHAPNENLALDRYFAGIRIGAAVYAALADYREG